MTTPTLIIYDDGQGRFGPVATLLAIFEVRTGARLTRERIQHVFNRPAGILSVSKRLSTVVSQRHPQFQVNPETLGEGVFLLVNGRWCGVRFSQQVRELQPDQAVVQSDGQVVAACLNSHDADAFINGGYLTLPDKTRTIRTRDRALIQRPWHLLDELPANLLADLLASDTPVFQPNDHPGVTAFGDHPVRVGQAARIMPSAVIDAEHGPVVIETGAVINPLTVLQGPCYIGHDSVLVSHTSIRKNTVIGPHCKVGGEVAASIFQSHSNKSHAGYLGDTLVGAWVNLGADTCISNLKNTYNPVCVQLDQHSPTEDTGRTFQGAIIGDYVRTAIGTRLTTGSVIHTGCMIAVTGWAPKLATAFGFYTDTGRQPYDMNKLIATLHTVMGRRDSQLSKEQEDLIRSLPAGD
jgi:UDP-N-acetylglucosamine diphosphorylase/glucosamine-1-phosphate N-acetyltransferase